MDLLPLAHRLRARVCCGGGLVSAVAGFGTHSQEWVLWVDSCCLDGIWEVGEGSQECEEGRAGKGGEGEGAK